MASARPLHELLADLVGDADAVRAHGDPEAYLAAHGHPDLPPDLVAEAVVSYADTAPVEVAEHLAPYVTTHSAVPADEPPADDWFGLITTAPADDLDPDPDFDDVPDDHVPPDHSGPALDFGTGSVDALDEPSTEDTEDTAHPGDDTGSDGSPDAGDHSRAPAWDDLGPDSTDPDALDADSDEDSDDDSDSDSDDLD
ncbi:MAG TPA: hypothetical protein VGP26_27630 [Actinophytocola sp.]|jgi:hypothetical protein|nr:hypothetical protein [Actinophytocola sp.]